MLNVSRYLERRNERVISSRDIILYVINNEELIANNVAHLFYDLKI